jgi:hypothetical protein
MEYDGRYGIFDQTQIKTYPLRARANKVKLPDLIRASDINTMDFDLPAETVSLIDMIAQETVSRRKEGKPVVLFTGAHLIKNGLSRLLVDLVNRDILTLVAGNGATAIHDFELALTGETSEDVPGALGKGEFGMAYEFAYINRAVAEGNKRKLGYGESLGKMICDAGFREQVLSSLAADDSPRDFLHPEVSVIAACYQRGIPFSVHVGIGTDVTDQHPSFDGQAKGGCSARDFLIYTGEIAKLTGGGVVFNIGSAVTGPEVLLKAVSMAANAGRPPKDIITADFDLRRHSPDEKSDESAGGYYFRDQKSIVTRIPRAFDGTGLYVQGNQKQTFPLLYKNIVEKL